MKTSQVFHLLVTAAAVGAALMLSACKQNGNMPYAITIELVASGFDHPTAFAMPPDGSKRIFVTEQTGAIKIINSSGAVLPGTFLDLSSRMVKPSAAYDESGLLGLVFHPDYGTNGRFFVFYNAPPAADDPAGFHSDVHVSEFRVSAGDPDTADSTSETVLVNVPHPQSNHNAGQLAFGPDGYLYIGIGDGGNADDVGPGHTEGLGNAQDLTKLLGKILRIDVSVAGMAAIPPTNPFSGDADKRAEIYAYGFRNPWRFSFDRGGDRRLFSADVGQNLFEEINIVTSGGNYGWHIREGFSCLNTAADKRPLASCSSVGAAGEPLIDPIMVYSHPGSGDAFTGSAVIAGFVYRGTALPALTGKYIFGDWSRSFSRPAGSLLVATESGVNSWSFSEAAVSRPGCGRGDLNLFLLSFGEDESGELYLLTSKTPGPSGTRGEVYKITGFTEQQ